MIEWISEDELGCACGNEPWISGFYAADIVTKEEVEPYIGGTWDGKTWFCAGCGAVEEVTPYD